MYFVITYLLVLFVQSSFHETEGHYSACIHVCRHTHIHTYMHTYIHTYIHTHIWELPKIRALTWNHKW